MNNKLLIDHFYAAFARGDAEQMVGCYHDEIEFRDPVFGKLKGEAAKNMWRMLLGRNKNITVLFDRVTANHNTGAANWQAEYVFGPTGRKVINKIHAQFLFENGRIIRHTDEFNLWKWSRQAMGWKGYLLGWTPFMQNKIKEGAGKSLASFMKQIPTDQ
jgi:ketosteroid isomerase-like protein